MAAHEIDGPTALGMLRDRAGPGHEALISLSRALIDSYPLLARRAPREAPPQG